MNDPMEVEILRGERARLLLEDPLIVEAFQTTEQELTDQWLRSPVRDVEGREKLYLTLRCLQKVQGHLTSVMNNGTIAKATLAQRAGRTLRRAFS